MMSSNPRVEKSRHNDVVFPWIVGDDCGHNAYVRSESLARQFAASDEMLAQLKSNEIALREFSEMEGVSPGWRRLAKHEAGWIRELVERIKR